MGALAEKTRKIGRRANDLDGAKWTRHSISVWSDIRKTPEEARWKHPAMFPSALVERLIDCFTTSDDQHVLDPFMGSGSTIVAAERRQKTGIGLEISRPFIELTRRRVTQTSHHIIRDDARNLLQHVAPGSARISA